jgi:hypothetical protein
MEPHDQNTVRDALRDRRHRRSRTSRRYEDITVEPATAVAGQTRAATVDHNVAALASHRAACCGTCSRCQRPRQLHALTFEPVEMLCRHCEPLDAA